MEDSLAHIPPVFLHLLPGVGAEQHSVQIPRGSGTPTAGWAGPGRQASLHNSPVLNSLNKLSFNLLIKFSLD